MVNNLGVVKPGSTLYVYFDSFAGATGASITLTGLAVTDIEIFKNGSVTQRASDNGYTLLDTDGIDFDGITGIHGFSISLADNSDAGFYAAGADYVVVISAVTIDTQTVNFVAARFTIGYEHAVLNTTIATLASQTSFTLTAGPAEDDALNGCEVVIHDVASAVQVGRAIVLDYTGSTKTVTLIAGATFTAAATDNISIFLSALQPTVQGRTVDVTATGAVGIDWANVENPTTALNLSATNIDVDQVVASVSGAVGSVTGAVGSVTGAVGSVTGNVGGNVTGSVGSVVGAVGSVTGAVGSVTGNVGGNVVGSVGSVVAGVTLAASAIQAIWDALTAALTTANSIGKLIVDNLNATVTSRASAAQATAIQADTDDIQTRIPAALVGGRIDASVGAMAAGVIAAATFAANALDAVWSTAARTLTAFGFSVTVGTNNDKTAYTTTAADQQASADELLNRNIAGGGSGGARIVRDAFRLLRNLRQIVAGTLTVMQEDDATPAWTATITQTAGDPVSKIDPA